MLVLSDMRLFTYPRPTVAAVNGDPFAGALITAAVCDHRVAVAEKAKFGLNEVPIGIPMPAVYVRMLASPGGSPRQRARAYSAKSSLPQRPTRWGWCTSWSMPMSCWTGRQQS
ncbi:MAG TPA: enoyl-CoA hydratase/isomerase family protein, partial [Mycobacterium sp.]|nr:enoyl-CoA hydratase/isomerase family protein [Mycobacterium sp.]